MSHTGKEYTVTIDGPQFEVVDLIIDGIKKNAIIDQAAKDLGVDREKIKVDEVYEDMLWNEENGKMITIGLSLNADITVLP